MEPPRHYRAGRSPKFVFAVGDEHGDAARIETGFQSNQIIGQRPQRIAVGRRTPCSICSPMTLCTTFLGWSPPALVSDDQRNQDVEFMPQPINSRAYRLRPMPC